MFENLLKEIFGTRTKVVNNKIIKDLGETVAHIEFNDGNYRDHFDKIKVTIVNKKSLVSFHQIFEINEYLKRRVDTRSDYSGDFYIWKYNGTVDWYIAKPHPDELKALAKIINDYIKLYKVQ